MAEQKENKKITFKNPNFGRSYGHPDFEKTLWFVMRPMMLIGQSSYARHPQKGGQTTSVKPMNYVFKFLAPKEFVESVVHEWVDYESLMGRFAGKWGELKKNATDLIGGIKAGGKGALSGITEASVSSGMNAAAREAMKTTVQNFRVDAPLYYKGSERRKYDLVFQLIEEGSPFDNIVRPVRILQQLAAPQAIEDSMVDIKPPCVFELTTEPEPWIKIPTAALRSIQPTYRGPYINGFPSSCELTLSFEDITPLFDTSFNEMKMKIDIREKGGQLPK